MAAYLVMDEHIANLDTQETFRVYGDSLQFHFDGGRMESHEFALAEDEDLTVKEVALVLHECRERGGVFTGEDLDAILRSIKGYNISKG